MDNKIQVKWVKLEHGSYPDHTQNVLLAFIAKNGRWAFVVDRPCNAEGPFKFWADIPTPQDPQ